MNKEFIPYEQALALKELGFDGECFGAYHNEDNLDLWTGEYDYSYAVKAPLYQQAFRWFREKGYISQIKFDNFHWSYGYQIDGEHHYSEESFIDFNATELECLKKLIEIVKNK